jgi:uncharacterized protein (TIGR03083 family)
METAPEPWIEALRSSQVALRALVKPLNVEELRRPSYASEWSIAQVLSHLGSQAEIFGLLFDAGLSGEDPPGQDAFAPIWDAWNARDPQAQASGSLAADQALVERFESLDHDQKEQFRLNMFGMDLNAAGLARMRLGEHAIHTWDVAVALDPTATVAPAAVELLIDTLDGPAARSGKAEGEERRVHVATTDPTRQFTLEVGEKVALEAGPPDGNAPDLQLPAEGFVRLVYGRLDADHAPPVESPGVELDQLRRIFPGF